jgi:solute carrier family 25 2-oxodicarboxylate transporter 21
MSTAQQPLPFHYNLFAGAVAGVTEILCTYPLDVVKTRFQIQVGAAEYSSIADCFKKIIKNEGFGTLYRGIVPPIMVEAPKRAIKFGANEQYKKFYSEYFGIKGTVFAGVLTGMSAGVTEATVVSFPDLIKIRYFLFIYRLQDKRNAGLYKNSNDVIKHIIKTEGIYGMGRGLEATVLRHGVWNAGYFSCITFIKDAMPKATSQSDALLYNFIAGSLGGTFGTILNVRIN